MLCDFECSSNVANVITTLISFIISLHLTCNAVSKPGRLLSWIVNYFTDLAQYNIGRFNSLCIYAMSLEFAVLYPLNLVSFTSSFTLRREIVITILLFRFKLKIMIWIKTLRFTSFLHLFHFFARNYNLLPRCNPPVL